MSIHKRQTINPKIVILILRENSQRHRLHRKTIQKRYFNRNKLCFWGFDSTFQSAVWGCHPISLLILSNYYLVKIRLCKAYFILYVLVYLSLVWFFNEEYSLSSPFSGNLPYTHFLDLIWWASMVQVPLARNTYFIQTDFSGNGV